MVSQTSSSLKDHNMICMPFTNKSFDTTKSYVIFQMSFSFIKMLLVMWFEVEVAIIINKYIYMQMFTECHRLFNKHDKSLMFSISYHYTIFP